MKDVSHRPGTSFLLLKSFTFMENKKTFFDSENNFYLRNIKNFAFFRYQRKYFLTIGFYHVLFFSEKGGIYETYVLFLWRGILDLIHLASWTNGLWPRWSLRPEGLFSHFPFLSLVQMVDYIVRGCVCMW